ncbi:hypothetical protein Q5530_28335 [Saccharothrix sp. BKS2]
MRGGDAQGERQAAAQPHQLAGRPRLGGDARPADHPVQHRGRVPGAEHVEPLLPGALAGHQAVEPVPAGHHHRAVRCAGQQGADLTRVHGVVEQHQHPPVGQRRAVDRSGAVHAGGSPGRVDLQRLHQLLQRLPRGQRRPGAVPAQVHEQLPAGEAGPVEVGPVQGQRGLAHARGAGQDVRHRAAGLLGRPAQGAQRLVPAHEAPRRGRQLGDAGGGRAGFGPRCSRAGVPGQEPVAQVPQRGARVGAQLVGQSRVDPAVVLQRVGGAPGLVQGRQVLAGDAFVQGWAAVRSASSTTRCAPCPGRSRVSTRSCWADSRSWASRSRSA